MSAPKTTRFAGYAALFDRVDRGGDVIRAGAFARATPPLPVFWQHDPTRQVGTVERLSEDARGLRVIARIERDGEGARVATGMGLSFGYRVKGMSPRVGNGGTNRQLTDLELIEVSIVAHPMQPFARVHAVEANLP